MYKLYSLCLTDEEKKTLHRAAKILQDIADEFDRYAYTNIYTGEMHDLGNLDGAISTLWECADGFRTCATQGHIEEIFDDYETVKKNFRSELQYYKEIEKIDEQNARDFERLTREENGTDHCEEYDIEECDVSDPIIELN